MFCGSKFSGLSGATERDIGVIRRGESDKDFIRGGKRSEGERDEGSGDLIKQQREIEGSSDQKEGMCSLSFVPSAKWTWGAYRWPALKLAFGSVSTLPLGIDGEGTGGGTVAKHNRWLMPIDMGIMFSEPSVTEDNVVVS